MMKGITIKQPLETEVVELNKPAAGNGEVLLKVKYVGCCGSDLTTYLGRNPMVQYPRIPGHEISAVIEAMGADVPAQFQPGQFVTVVPYTNCGQCPSCKRQRANACQFNETLGVQRQGAMCEYIVVPWQKLLLAPNLSPIELAMVEPLTVGFHAIDRAKVTDIDTVMVLGCGMIGMGAIIRSVLRGAKVIAVDIDDDKLALVKQLGVSHTINSKQADWTQQLAAIVPGGPDVVIEAAGSPLTYLAALQHVAFTGRVACIGYAKDEIATPTKLIVQKEMDLMGSRNATPSDFQAVINYLQLKTFPVDKVVTRVVTPNQFDEAMIQWSNAPGKVFKILVEF
jgi:threonine dehydrogenase-like Zn-dependent dehydrogenase